METVPGANGVYGGGAASSVVGLGGAGLGGVGLGGVGLGGGGLAGACMGGLMPAATKISLNIIGGN